MFHALGIGKHSRLKEQVHYLPVGNSIRKKKCGNLHMKRPIYQRDKTLNQIQLSDDAALMDIGIASTVEG
jgi:hypothetical protein